MSIWGKPTGNGTSRADWNQEDESRADFIKNKPLEDLEKAKNALPKAGGTMTGPIAMGGNKVTGLGFAESDGDAVSKEYLEDFYSGRVFPVTASLPDDGWNEKAQTIEVEGVTASNTVIVTPAPASWLAYGEAGVRCTAQGAGNLTFRCEEAPAAALAVNILVLN